MTLPRLGMEGVHNALDQLLMNLTHDFRPAAQDEVQARKRHVSFRLRGGRGETEIFVPRLQYPNGYDVEVEGGEAARDEENQSLRIHAISSSKVAVMITRR